MAQECDGVVQAIRSIPVRAILRQNQFDLPLELYEVACGDSVLQKEEIIRFAEHLIKSENDLAVLG